PSWPPLGSPSALDRKDVPHLSESVVIGVQKQRFVESLPINLEDSPISFIDYSTTLRCRTRPLAESRRGFFQPSASARSTMSCTSRESEEAPATRRRAACASSWRLGSSTLQLLSADRRRAASCGFLGSIISTVSTRKS